MSGHTPGPWKVVTRLSGSENHKGYHICSEAKDGYGLAMVQPFDEDGIQGGINARLIAAAPDLYALATYAVDNPTFDSAEFDRMARAAIAKATGAKP